MREVELRQKVVSVATRYLGYSEAKGQDDIIINKYNRINKSGMYDMTMNDAWCAAFGSVVGHEAGLSEIIPIECSCQRKIDLWKALGSWEENGNIIPNIGDYIYYNWDDSTQPNDGWSDHEGIVTKIVGNTITIIEGNKNDSVEYRTINVGWGYIRGYGRPNYAKLATPEITPTSKTFALGDIVEFTGNTHYTSSYAGGTAKQCKPGKAEITAISGGKPHPYHLVGIDGKSNVYGWVDAKDIAGAAKVVVDNTIKVGDKVKVLSNVTYTGSSFKTWYDTYDVIQVNGERVVIGRGKVVTCAINIKNIKKV